MKMEEKEEEVENDHKRGVEVLESLCTGDVIVSLIQHAFTKNTRKKGGELGGREGGGEGEIACTLAGRRKGHRGPS